MRKLPFRYRLAVVALLVLALLPAQVASAGGGRAQIKNKVPSIESVTISPDADATLDGVQVNPTPQGTTTVTVTIEAKDLNGYNDISSVSVVVYQPDGTTVHVPAGDASLASGHGVRGTWTYSFGMNYYDTPATDGASYKVVVTATDVQGATADNSASPATFNYTELLSITVDTATIDFGAIDPGETSDVSAVTVTNQGNVTLDVVVSGTALTYQSNSIDVSQIDYSLDADFSSATALSTAGQTIDTFDLSAGAGSTKPLYFRLRVPSAENQYLPAGSYEGTISIIATTSQ